MFSLVSWGFGILGVVLIDELRKPQGARHSRRPTTYDNDVRLHYGTINAWERFAKDDHWPVPANGDSDVYLILTLFAAVCRIVRQ